MLVKCSSRTAVTRHRAFISATRSSINVVRAASGSPNHQHVHSCSDAAVGGPSDAAKRMLGAAGAVSLSLALVLGPALPSEANARKVGEFDTSGLLFKDKVELIALDDPDVAGVTIYISDFKRNIVDKLAKDFFSEPSQASLTCAVTGPVTIKEPRRLQGDDGREIFSEGKGLNFFKNKTLRVRRLFDEPNKSLVYVAYSTRLSTAADEGGVTSGRYRTSLCALRLPEEAFAPPPAAEEAS